MRHLFIILILQITLLLTCFGNFSYSQVPTWQWAKDANGGMTSNAFSNTTDKYGNIYACGYVNQLPINFDIFSVTYRGFYITKYSTNGTILKLAGADGPSGISQAHDIEVDSSGNIYVIGFFGDSLWIGNNLLIGSPNNLSMFIAKYDSSFNVVWCKEATSSNAVYGNTLAIGKDQNIYLGGTFIPDMTFGNDTFTTVNSENGFVSKISSSGNILWSRQITNNNPSGISQIQLDTSLNIYVSGPFENGITIGSTVLAGPLNSSFLANFDNNGNPVWARKFPFIQDLKIYKENLYILGTSFDPVLTIDTFNLIFPNNDLYFCKLSTSGLALIAKKSGFSGPTEGRVIGVDNDESIYIAGSFGAPITINGITLPCSGFFDIFLAKFLPNGNPIWGARAGALAMNHCTALCLDQTGNVYLSGSYTDTTSFGNTGLFNWGQTPFLAKLNSTLSIAEVVPQDSAIIYPNPGNGQLVLKIKNGNYNIIVHNTLGQRISSTNCHVNEGNAKLNFSHFSDGIYWLEVSNDDNKYSSKFVIQH